MYVVVVVVVVPPCLLLLAHTLCVCVCGNRFEQSSGPTRFLIIVLSPVYTSIDVYVPSIVDGVGGGGVDLNCGRFFCGESVV